MSDLSPSICRRDKRSRQQKSPLIFFQSTHLHISRDSTHITFAGMEIVNGGHSGRRLDQINLFLQQLVDDKKKNGNRRFFTKEEHQLISHLLSQLEELQKDRNCDSSDGDGVPDEDNNIAEEGKKHGDSKDDILEELGKMKRQNVITQYFISGLIGVTIIWQFSEISMILMLMNNVANPCQAIYGFIRDSVMKGKGGGGNPKNEDMLGGVAPLIEQLEMPEMPSFPETEDAAAAPAHDK